MARVRRLPEPRGLLPEPVQVRPPGQEQQPEQG